MSVSDNFVISSDISFHSMTPDQLSGCVLYYGMNTSGTTIADSVTGKIGSIFGSLNGVGFVDGKVGSACLFSGVSCWNLFDTTANLRFTSGQSFSLAAWVYLSGGLIQAGAGHGIIGRGTTSFTNYNIDLQSGLRLRFGERSGTQIIGLVTSIPVTMGTWNHVAGVYDASNFTNQIFLNGNPGSQLSTGGSVFGTSTGSVTIGRTGVIGGNVGSQMIIYIDEAVIYNRALTRGEVQILSQTGSYSGYTFSTGDNDINITNLNQTELLLVEDNENG